MATDSVHKGLPHERKSPPIGDKLPDLSKGSPVAKLPALQSTNMVMVIPLNRTLNLPALYELLTLAIVDFVVGTNPAPGGRAKVPYFGKEQVIVGARFRDQSRGIRKNGGQLRNVVAIDLQHCQKNIHLKVSETKITMMGLLSEAMGTTCAQVLLAHIDMVQNHWLHLRGLSSETLNASIQWLCGSLYEEDGKRKSDAEIADVFAKIPEGIDERGTRYLSMFAEEYELYSDFAAKLQTVLTLPTPICPRLPTLGLGKISNAVYNYNIGSRVSLITLCQELLKRGYGASYHNFHRSKSLQVVIPLSPEERQWSAEGESDDDLPTPDDSQLSEDVQALATSSEASDLPVEGLGDDLVSSPEGKGELPLSGEKESLTSEVSQPNLVESKTHTKSKTKIKLPAHRFTIYQGGAIRQTSPCIHIHADQARNKLLRDVREILEKGPRAPMLG